ncbi:PAS modulated sigma54 specific transcriptional regulator, Fis family [Candidatus Vecturithrix granuli]|uniref:PAS modulated sigma54 specific transcriptional regulator, Fis family n=1 Tax=Vecturithrix granuli TaxID=1499967 RepID=A0A081C2Y0_VECG1|nr:PAS modulated sigma54 specific transcriptional regulator, Fis family [Candidatus Vecturithrix granuli]
MVSKMHTSLKNSPLQKRPTIGLLIVGVFPPNEQLLWSGVMDAARQYDANLISFCGSHVHHPDPVVAQANVLYQLPSPRNLDGLLVCSGALTWYLADEDLLTFFRRYHPLPCISLDRAVPGIPSVIKDDYQGMYDALIHLIEEHDYCRIAFLQGIAGAEWGAERYRAYMDALQAHDIRFDPRLVVSLPAYWDSSGVPLGGEEQVRILLEERKLRPKLDIEAIVGATDDLARQALTALQARQINVPQEIALVGFDDEERSRVVTPPLTTVRNRMYEIGWKGVENLLAQLGGETMPEQVVVPTLLTIRQSCGCRSALISRSTTGTIANASDLSNVDPVTQRDLMMAELTQSFGRVSGQDVTQWVESLREACHAEIIGTAPGLFLSRLETLLNQNSRNGGDVIVWHDLVSALRRLMLPNIDPSERTHAEDLWGQARVLIGETAQRVQAFHTVQAKQQAQLLREIGATLITTFDVAQLMHKLEEILPGLGITSCYLALYDAESETQQAQSHRTVSLPFVPEWSRLILAYNEHGRAALEPSGRRFHSAELVPADLLPQDRQYSLVLEPLFFQDSQIGLLLLETGPREGSVYEALRAEISSALQGDLLVQRVQERTVEITRQKYILDTFMETVPDSIYFKDRESRITRANQAHARQLGLDDPAEEVGKTDFDFFPEHAARVKCEQERVIMQTGQPVVSIEEASGQGQWLLTTKMPLRDERGEIVGTFGISRNITSLKHTEHELVQYREHLKELVKERTTELTRSNAQLSEEILERLRVERALRASEEQYRLLADNVKDGIVIIQHGKFVFANAAFAAMTGYGPKQFLALEPLSLFADQTDSMAAISLPGENQQIQESRWQAELLTHSRRLIWAEIEQSEIVWDSQPAHLLTIRDITNRKHREQRLEEERTRLEAENLSLKSSIKERYRFGALMGKSAVMQRVYELIVSAAASDVNVLISGESGTGKELIARTLHQISRRNNQAFVPVNCASIPETLFEREFFGHRKGAFTGADRDASGLFDKAHRGTLFLDEVTELTPGMQAKLLRVLQDGEYTPLGSTSSKQADVVIVAATNKDYQEEIRQRRLRKDFFYRIGVIEIRVPALRERKDDVPLLIEHILEDYCQKHLQIQSSVPQELPVSQAMLPGELVQVFYTYDWPGNVRELQNVVQRYLATQDAPAILALLGSSRGFRPISETRPALSNLSLPETVQAFEKQVIADMLSHNQYHIGRTADMLGIPRLTLYRKIKKYQLKTPK